MSERATHWPGCWESDTHGACARIHARAAVDHIHKLQEELAVISVERDEALEALRELVRIEDGAGGLATLEAYNAAIDRARAILAKVKP